MSNLARNILQEQPLSVSSETEHSQILEHRYQSALTSQGSSCSSNEDSNMSQVSVASANSHDERPRALATARKQ